MRVGIRWHDVNSKRQGGEAFVEWFTDSPSPTIMRQCLAYELEAANAPPAAFGLAMDLDIVDGNVTLKNHSD